MNTKYFLISIVLAVGGSGLPLPAPAQAPAPSCTSTQVSENFTGNSTNCQWYFFGGACLTAGNIPYGTAVSPGLLPQCVGDTYYGGQTQVGGTSGTLPDSPVTGGALRFTNDANAQSGAIVSNFAFALQANGLHVTFTTETYEGDHGGANQDGADGMSFFLVDDSYVESANPVTGASYGANNGGPYGVTLGDWGGSLGYTCSNTNNSANQGYAGMIGGYMGLGIDEFGNFLNGDTVDGAGAISYYGDNTSSGYGYVPNRVGLRGAGATAWAYLSRSPTTSAYYPVSLSAAQRTVAVHQACQTGYAWDYSAASTTWSSTVTNGVANPYNATPQPTILLSNYQAIPLANQVLPTKIANEAALYRGYATPGTTGAQYGIPITYDLSISTAGLLSLSYSFGGGLYQPIITRQSILNNGATLPSMVRFGFGGSTGGSRNIHEIMCFQAAPQNSSSSSAGLNQKQTAKVQTGTQVYFAFYNPNNWSGSLTSQYLDSTDGVNLQIDPALNWDASCNLTGPATGQTCPSTPAGAGATAAQNPDTGRVMLTYNEATGSGIPFTWSSAGVTPLSANEQAKLDYGDPSPASSAVWPYASNLRLEYLRGQRGDEQNQYGVDPLASTSIPAPTGFRQRTSVLGDIIDSSPTWVGPPIAAFPTIWSDYLYPSTTMPENSGATYASFQTANTSRMNVVYAGSNDGFLHGFRSGFFDANGQLDGTSTTSPYGATDNDGKEVLAFMPAYVVNHINAGGTFNSVTGTYDPNPAQDFSNPLYGHKLSVDGTPGDGDLFYNGAWHTWLVGGLGGGGSDIYALDVTNPGIGTAAGNFTEANASSIVIGEWYSTLSYTVAGSSGTYTSTVSGASPSPNFLCANVANCWQSLGKTYGIPQIRRFHNTPANTANGATSWGAVFGNGFGSYNGDAGIFVMLANPSGGQPSFSYLSTGYGSSTNPDGIGDVTPADLDGDHITDYVYTGDLLGNVWRFDLTSQNPSNWTVTKVGGVPTPIYSTPSGAPITTKVIVASIASTPNPRVLVEFGTGVQNQFNNNGPATYATAQQYLVGVWDWNMSAWDAVSTVTYDALSTTTTPLAPTSGGVPAPINGLSKLEGQSITGSYDQTDAASGSSSSTSAAAYYRTVSTNCVGWADFAGTCTTSNQYGWYLPLGTGYANANDPEYLTPTTSQAAQFVDEQVIFNPTLQDGAFIVNTTIPPTTSINTCSSTPAGGWTMAINPATGGAFTNSFFAGPNGQFQNIANQVVSGVALGGTGSPSVVIFDNKTYLVTQTMPPAGTIVQINPPGASQGSRLTWIERR
jgi:type IV pilus assembly protein PilY1